MAGRQWEYIFGKHSTGIDINEAPADLWPLGTLYAFSTGPSTVTGMPATVLFSATSGDEFGGDGAIAVAVEGLDASWQSVRQVVLTAGTCEVTLNPSLVRVNKAVTLAVGSNEFNKGNIDIETLGVTLGRIPEQTGQLQQAIYTVPEGGRGLGFIKAWKAQILRPGANYTAEVNLRTRANSTDYVPSSWRVRDDAVASDKLDGGRQLQGDGFKIRARTDVTIEIIDVSNNGTMLSGSFDIDLT